SGRVVRRVQSLMKNGKELDWNGRIDDRDVGDSAWRHRGIAVQVSERIGGGSRYAQTLQWRSVATWIGRVDVARFAHLALHLAVVLSLKRLEEVFSELKVVRRLAVVALALPE